MRKTHVPGAERKRGKRTYPEREESEENARTLSGKMMQTSLSSVMTVRVKTDSSLEKVEMKPEKRQRSELRQDLS